MSLPTYLVRTAYSQCEALTRGWMWDGVLVIENTTTDKAVMIHSINGYQVTGAYNITTGNNYLTQIEVDPITSIVGGTDLTPVKMDSSAGSLPSQVKCVFGPDVVTLGSGIFRRFLPLLQSAAEAGSMFGFHQGPLAYNPNSPATSTVSHYLPTEAEQPITLREGEGLAIHISVAGFLQSGLYVKVMFTDSATSKSYVVTSDLVSLGPGKSIFALLNGSGSGKVYYVNSVTVHDEAEYTTVIRKYRMCLGEMWVSKGDPVAAVKVDSASAAFPSGVKIWRNAYAWPKALTMPPETLMDRFQKQLDNSALLLHGRQAMVFGRRRDQHAFGLGGNIFAANMSEDPVYSTRGGHTEPITVNPGQSFAIFSNAWQNQVDSGQTRAETLPTSWMNYSWSCMVTVADYVAPGGYPLEGNVRLGIDYGSYEGEFTGNVVIPDEADVKLGVDYGALGTEYEGTYSPTGGGGVSRGRVVNT